MKKKLLALTLALGLSLVIIGCGVKDNADIGGDAHASENVSVNNSVGAEIKDDNSTASLTDSSETASSGGEISRDKAKELALSRAGVNAADVKNLEIELDRDNGVLHYDIEFDVGRVEYDLEIDAKSGEVIKFEKDGVPVSNNGEYIERDRALEIALEKAGVSEADAKRVEVSLDADERVPKYEIEFVAGGFEYDYDINAKTGEVIRQEKERAD